MRSALAEQTIRVAAGDTAAEIAARISQLGQATGVTATADATARLQLGAAGGYVRQIRSDNGTPLTVTFRLLGTEGHDGLSVAVDAFNAISSKTGVFASYDADSKTVLLKHPAGNDTMVGDTGFRNADDVTVTKPRGASIATAGVLFADGVAENAVVAGASGAIKTADAALAHVNGERARLGALQSRFETAIANLSTASENMSAARSRIQDADFAQETAHLARAQILQPAGTAMVAQANQIPQGVLALLKL